MMQECAPKRRRLKKLPTRYTFAFIFADFDTIALHLKFHMDDMDMFYAFDSHNNFFLFYFIFAQYKTNTTWIIIGGIGATGCREAGAGAPKVVGGYPLQKERASRQD